MTYQSADPVAVLGIGCRFPGGADSPDRYWSLLRAAKDTSGPAPSERWQHYADRGPSHAAALRRTVAYGSFLTGVEDFDADFFGLSPREAELMDPQQRLVLETTWEALEQAGVPPTALAGTDTGVYVGVCTGDYGHRLLEDLPDVEAWTGIGAATCAVANRVSYALDLRGPSLAVDTACSASLVAVHLACQSLRAGESELALAGGVNLILSPGETLTLDAAGALAADGRSKSFDVAADGYGRGEGGAVVVLKRLSDAVRDGDRVLATIIGSAVNQDGHTNGIMAPCGAAQEHVMLRACQQAGIDPGTVDFIEAHGTGTAVGDPLEAAALAAVYGAGRSARRPCLIGSAKSSIGHLEGAAGIAGLVKAVLAMERGEIPPSRLDKPNPAVDWVGGGLRVVTEPTSWPDTGRSRRAAVSAFGYGGTVAHVLLEQAPAVPSVSGGGASVSGGGVESTAVDGTAVDGAAGNLFPVSAASPEALRQAAGQLADRVGDAGLPVSDFGHTLALRRSHLAHRAVVAATDRDTLSGGLRALAAGDPHHAVTTGRVLPDPGPGPVFVFSGHGSQWAGMGRELLTEPAFAAVIDELEPVFTAETGFSPREVLTGNELTGVDRIQIMIFAMQLGLVELWRGYGVLPRAVIGHSVGEIAAAVTAGGLTRADATRLICRRSGLLRRVAGRGAMALVQLPFADTIRRLSGRSDVVAAIASSPGSTVVSGDPAAVAEVLDTWLAQGVPARRVPCDVAFHGPHMDPLLAGLTAAAADLAPAVPSLPMYPTALDDPRATPRFDAGYWAANLRNPVRLAQAVQAAAADGYRVFLEISPHPVVTHSVLETLTSHGYEDVFVGASLRRDRPARATLRSGAAAAHCHGVPLDWSELHSAGGLVTLPGYAWQRRRHWRVPSIPDTGGRGHDPRTHALLGDDIRVTGTEVRLWRTSLDDTSRPYPGSHAIDGVEIVPAAVLVATFFAASGGQALEQVAMRAPLMTAPRRDVQVVRHGAELRLAARTAGGDQDATWLLIATATVAPKSAGGSMNTLRPRSLVPADPALVGRRLTAVGVPETGFDWTIEELLRGEGVLRARVRTGPAKTWAPALDAAMSIAPSVFGGDPVLRMVVHVDRAETVGEPPDVVQVEVSLAADLDDTAGVLLADTSGTVIGRLAGLRYPVIGAPVADDGDSDHRPAATSFAGLTPEELRARLAEEVSIQIAGEMRLAPADLAPRRPLIEQGLDSVLTVVVRRRLEKRFRCSLPTTLLWRQPTIAAIADHIAEVLTAAEPSGSDNAR